MKNKLLIILLISIILLYVSISYRYLNKDAVISSGVVSESEAIEIIKNQFPKMKEYPSDGLAPKSIKTEKVGDSWYLAFIQEGSGVPIIDAKCFLVVNNINFVQFKYVPQDNIISGEFSAKKCRVIESIVGGDKDEHGCIGSAGYSWCEEKQKCLRVWEESCEGNSESQSCAVENCHELDIRCGFNPVEACTAIYMIGDKCLKYAKCGFQNGICKQIQNSQFTECKSCVQACIEVNKTDNIKLFECESKCG